MICGVIRSIVCVSVETGPWQDHVGSFWDHRHDKNVLFLRYEDLHQVVYLMLQILTFYSEHLGLQITVGVKICLVQFLFSFTAVLLQFCWFIRRQEGPPVVYCFRDFHRFHCRALVDPANQGRY